MAIRNRYDDRFDRGGNRYNLSFLMQDWNKIVVALGNTEIQGLCQFHPLHPLLGRSGDVGRSAGTVANLSNQLRRSAGTLANLST